uniref:Uncharacterized protein n=1 Tax=Glossina pallidipes TaxID=7398 RepID=A0A1A9ZF28_GLOPL
MDEYVVQSPVSVLVITTIHHRTTSSSACLSNATLLAYSTPSIISPPSTIIIENNGRFDNPPSLLTDRFFSIDGNNLAAKEKRDAVEMIFHKRKRVESDRCGVVLHIQFRLKVPANISTHIE